MILLGFAITRHCNLRCPHCIRDDVVTPAELDAALIGRVIAEAQAMFGEVRVSLTGGEPLIHRDLSGIVRTLKQRGVRWGFVTNGWHLPRVMPLLDTHPPSHVRLSLSGAREQVHDAERGRGSFRRVMLAAAVLTSRRIPFSLTLLVTRSSRADLRPAADLAESLGAMGFYAQLAQPVPSSAARDADLSPAEWRDAVREVHEMAREPHRRAHVGLDYGAPPLPGEPLVRCDTFAERRVYVNHLGELCLCCQLSEYGALPTDAVADLARVPFIAAYAEYRERLAALEHAARPAGADDALAEFPCLRCARSMGKLAWLSEHEASPWHHAALEPAHA